MRLRLATSCLGSLPGATPSRLVTLDFRTPGGSRFSRHLSFRSRGRPSPQHQGVTDAHLPYTRVVWPLLMCLHQNSICWFSVKVLSVAVDAGRLSSNRTDVSRLSSNRTDASPPSHVRTVGRVNRERVDVRVIPDERAIRRSDIPKERASRRQNKSRNPSVERPSRRPSHSGRARCRSARLNREESDLFDIT
jgi:hypothetical protein